jgi:hypothetical protein
MPAAILGRFVASAARLIRCGNAEIFPGRPMAWLFPIQVCVVLLALVAVTSPGPRRPKGPVLPAAPAAEAAPACEVCDSCEIEESGTSEPPAVTCPGESAARSPARSAPPTR